MTPGTTYGSLYPGAHLEDRPDHPAIVMSGTGEVQTYAELDAAANRIAKALRRLGLSPGDHVALCLENRLEYPGLVWGAHYAGLYYTPISTHLTVGEIAYIVADSGSGVVILSDAMAAVLLEPLARERPALTFLTVGAPTTGARDLAELMSDQSPDPLADSVEGADMLYSSGTTGRPKGIKPALSGQPLGTTMLVATLQRAVFGMDETTAYLSPAPLYHAAPCKWTMGIAALGGTAVIMPRFDAEAAVTALERHHITHSQWVPTMFSRLLRLPDEVRAYYDLSRHRMALHAAAPCPVGVKQAMLAWWGPIIHEYYAGSEGNGLTYCPPEAWLAHPGSVGRAAVGQLHILDDDMEEVAPGQVGSVYFSGGPPVAYHNDQAKTDAAHSPQGWSTLGDIGHVDEDGFLYLTDRKSHMIISGGVNIYPQEAENVLAAHPAVLDVAVIGVPNEEFGEEVKAVVQLVNSTGAGPALEAALIAYCRDQLAAVKCPRSVDFRSELPRHPNGKLYKRLLRDEYWDGSFQPGSGVQSTPRVTNSSIRALE
jgi:fatty-acyl-CoA synthase